MDLLSYVTARDNGDEDTMVLIGNIDEDTSVFLSERRTQINETMTKRSGPGHS